MAERIATIKLNSGQGGFYDELTNIHLTVENPIAHLYAGQNFNNVRKGIAVGHLILMDGTLGPDPRPYRLVRVGNHLEIDIRPEAFKKAAKSKVNVVLKKETEEVKEEPKKAEAAKTAPEKAEVAPKTEEATAEEPAKEAEAEEKKAVKKAPAKRASKKATKKAEEE